MDHSGMKMDSIPAKKTDRKKPDDMADMDHSKMNMAEPTSANRSNRDKSGDMTGMNHGGDGRCRAGGPVGPWHEHDGRAKYHRLQHSQIA